MYEYQSREEVEEMLNQAYENVVEKEEKARKRIIDLSFIGVVVATILIFGSLNYIDQKNNKETIKILQNENQKLKSGVCTTSDLELKALSHQIDVLKKRNQFLIRNSK